MVTNFKITLKATSVMKKNYKFYSQCIV